MVIRSSFFNSVSGDRVYDASIFAEYFASFIGNGVFPNPSNNLQVTQLSGFQTVVRPGNGWINGYFMRNDSNLTLNHEISNGQFNRIDRIVMALNLNTREMNVYIKTGVASGTPVAPQLIRNGSVYELALADVAVNKGSSNITQSNITDQRLNRNLCGLVTNAVTSVDTQALFAQYEDFYMKQQEAYEVDFQQWSNRQRDEFQNFLNGIQNSLSGDVAGNLQVEINNTNDRITELDEELKMELLTKPDFKQDNISEVLISSFFRSNQDLSNDFYLSSDGIDFSLISDVKMPPISGRDPAFYYKDGTFYLALTHYLDPSDLFELYIYKSTNLRDWTEQRIKLGYVTAANPRSWAPKWFEDTDGKLYIFMSFQVGAVVYEGVTEFDFRPYYFEVIDLENLQFGPRVAIDLAPATGTGLNRIDIFMYKEDGIYSLFIKTEPTGHIERFTSSSLNGPWVLDSSDLLPNTKTEGVSVLKYRGRYYMYVDDIGGNLGVNMQVATATSINGPWSAPTKLITERTTRHGAPFVIRNRDAKLVVNDFVSSNAPSKIKVTTPDSQIQVPLINNVSGTTLNLLDEDDVTYYVSNNQQVTINNIVGRRNFKLVVLTDQTATLESITLINGSLIKTPNAQDLRIAANNGFSQVLVEVNFEKYFFFVKYPNLNNFVNNAIQRNDASKAKDIIALSSLAVGGVINNLSLENNRVYAVYGNEQITINSASFGDDGRVSPYNVYFAIFTAASSSASLTIRPTSGTKLLPPLNQQYVMTAATTADTIIKFGRPFNIGNDALRKMN